MSKKALIVVNFGGPRTLEEVPSFLKSLLTDEDVIRTPFPSFLQRKFFERIAKKRAPIVSHDYAKIGGGSPIYEDTNWFASNLSQALAMPAFSFHRYLESTHASFVEDILSCSAEEYIVFPLFPQFCYATTGSIARWFALHLRKKAMDAMKWVPSYAGHKDYILAFASCIKDFLKEKKLVESEVLLLFSAHGVPVQYIRKGDVYQKECETSFFALAQQFPQALSFLSYQSKFGRGAWLEPSTVDVCTRPRDFIQDKKHMVLIPLSFSSDHIETLFEMEGYAALVRDRGISAYRCPALGRRADWVQAAKAIVEEGPFVTTNVLIRP